MSIRYPICIAALWILLALAPPAAVCQNAVAGWTVNDISGAIALDSVEEHDSVFTVSFKNTSAAIVTAIAMSLEDGAYHYQDWFSSDSSGCAPGQIFRVTVGPEESAKRTVRIAAVLFEDGSGKGDTTQLDRINLHRFGQIMEATRIRNILHGRRKPEDDASIGDLRRKIGEMPASDDEAFRSLETVGVPGISLPELKQHGEKTRRAFFWGVSITREAALQHMENVKHLPVTSNDEKIPSRGSFLSFVKDIYERQNQKGIALLHRMKGGR